MAVWTFNGVYFQDVRKEIAGILTPPTVVSICSYGTANPIALYADRVSTAAQIPNGPMTTGVPIGSPGIDVTGNCFFFAPPGLYTPWLEGVRYPPIQILPDNDDLAALGGSSTSSSGQTLQLKTASTRASTDDGNTGGNLASAITLSDWSITLNPGSAFRFDGTLAMQSTFAAGTKLAVTASGTGAALWCVLRGPHVSDRGQQDSTMHRDVVMNGASLGAQKFGGYGAALSDGYVEILNGFVSLPSSAPAPGLLRFRFAQATTTAGVTTTAYDLKSVLSVVQLS